MQQEHPQATVEVWAEDEHRIGLHPVNRLVWVPLGEQPIAPVNWKYQWLWLVGFVEPTSGETYWWIVPWLNHEVFSRVLADFAEHFKLGAHKRVILVVDQAAFKVERFECLKEFICCFCRPTRQNCSLPNGCGL